MPIATRPSVLRQRLLMVAFLALMAAPSMAQDISDKENTKEEVLEEELGMGKKGPLTADLAEGELKLSGEYVFLNKEETQKIMRADGSQVNGSERGAVVPKGKAEWVTYFSFDAIGYVKDDEKDSIDADAILESYRASSNARNARNPQEPQWTVVGWRQKPHYDSNTHNLEWCIEFKVGQEPLLNHKIKVLGRRGVMDVTLACDPQNLTSALASTRAMLGGYSFKAGGKYEEWTTGDKVAAYGLTALVAGGAIAAAAKTGLLAKLIKPVLIGLAVVGGAIMKFGKSLFGRKDQ